MRIDPRAMHEQGNGQDAAAGPEQAEGEADENEEGGR